MRIGPIETRENSILKELERVPGERAKQRCYWLMISMSYSYLSGHCAAKIVLSGA